MSGLTDYYAILGVHPTAEDEVIAAAYRALAKKYHPDAVGSAHSERFIEIQEAYEVLRDPVRRQDYDEVVAEQQNGGFAPDKGTTGENPDAETAGSTREQSAGEKTPPTRREQERRAPVGLALVLGGLIIVSTVLAVNIAKNSPGDAVSAAASPKDEAQVGRNLEDEKLVTVRVDDETTAQSISGEVAKRKTSLAEAPSIPTDAISAQTVKAIDARVVGEMEVDGSAVVLVPTADGLKIGTEQEGSTQQKRDMPRLVPEAPCCLYVEYP